MSNALGCLVSFIFVTMITACASSEAGKEVNKATIDKTQILAAQIRPTGEFPLLGSWKLEAERTNSRGQWVNQEYRFTQNRFEMVQTTSLDKDFKKIQLVHRTEGIYQVISEGPISYLNFQITGSYLKLAKGAKSLKSLGIQNCQLKPGQEVLLDTKSCADFASIKDCNRSFDIVKISESIIELGKKPNFLRVCSEKNRPTVLEEKYRKIH